MKPAMYFKQLDDSKVQCLLCPHKCIIHDGKIGVCRARKNDKGTLYSINDGFISSYGYDPIEKKPLYHFHPGSIIFSIGSYGCNFHCQFCQNWEIVYNQEYMMAVSDEKLLQAAQQNGSIGMAYTYNEPTVWYEFMFRLAKEIKKKDMVNVMVTNGYINQEPLKELLPYMDAMNIDLKSIEDNYYKELCGGRIEPVLETIRTADKQCHVELTTLLIDGRNGSPEQIHLLAQTVANINPEIPLHFSRYFPAYKLEDPPTKVETLFQARDIALKYLKHVHIGNVPGME